MITANGVTEFVNSYGSCLDLANFKELDLRQQVERAVVYDDREAYKIFHLDETAALSQRDGPGVYVAVTEGLFHQQHIP